MKRSRFVCDLSPAASEEEARTFIDQVRSGTRDARHHCTAFVLGPDGATQRSNDDGEPSGTAGAPMLDVLRGRGLTDVVAVVTRWFGGTLLGTAASSAPTATPCRGHSTRRRCWLASCEKVSSSTSTTRPVRGSSTL